MEDSAALFGNTPTSFMFFPLIGILAIIASFGVYAHRRWKSGEQISVGSLLWAIGFCAILAFLSFWCASGFMDTNEIYLFQACLILTFGGCATVLRERSLAALENLDTRSRGSHAIAQVIRVVRDFAIVFCASEFCRLALELPSNERAYTLSNNSVVIELSVILSAMACAYFICQRRGVGPLLIALCCYFAGLAERFVIEFKQNAILPMELFALGTAADVGDQYTYLITTNDLRGLTFLALALVAISFIRPARSQSRRGLSVNIYINVICAVVAATCVTWWFTEPNYHDDFGYSISYWTSPNSYYSQGILPSFLTALEDMPLVMPDGYSHEEAEGLVARYASQCDDQPERIVRRAQSQKQFKEAEPSVVIVMNETFADLSRLNELNCAYEGPQFFKSMSDCLARGKIAVSVYGAGTCNTEFEVLTGNSLAFVGAGKYPYQMFDLSNTLNLARDFSEIGYRTTAIHPCPGDNWNRNVTYEALGFDQFLSTDNSFVGAPLFHNGITDKATYETILQQLADTSTPQFVFDVTMQNHGGYTIHNIPADRLTTYQPAGFAQTDIDMLNEYLSCIQASDEDLAWFVGELSKLDRPVVLVFFGDHHPKFSNVFNDVLFDPTLEDAANHEARVYQTDYIIWANYDVEGNDQVSQDHTVGTDCLGALTLDLIGAPLEDFHKAQLAVHRRLAAINTIGYLGTNGIWYTPGTMPYLDVTYRDMEKMDYLRFSEQFD